MAAESWTALAVAALALSMFAGFTAAALREFSRSLLEELCRSNQRLDRFEAVLVGHGSVAEAARAVQVLGLALAVGAACAAGHASPEMRALGPWLWAVLAAAGLWLVVLVQVDLAEWAARRWATAWVYRTWPFWALVRRLLSVSGFRLGQWLLRHLAPAPAPSEPQEEFEDEILTIVDEGHREGLLKEEARGMIEGVMDLRDAEVSEIMTPRTDMASLHVNRSLVEAANFAIEVGHSRIPVYDKNRDDVIGVLYVKDLLGELVKPTDQTRRPLGEIIRQPVFVPESKRVPDLLQEFRKTRNHMAVVLDEFGGVSGLITIEDVLEEIVGDIADEYDEAEVEEIKLIDERTAEVSARAHIDEVNERLGLRLSEESDFDTVGGFVFTELGRIPRAGEVVVCNNVRITVLEVSRRRIERLRIEVLDETPTQSSGN